MSSPLATTPVTDPYMILRYRDRQYAAELIAVLLLEFDFFSWLYKNPGSTTEQINQEFGFADRPSDVALTLCRANGFITSSGTHHELTTLGKEHLVKDSMWFLGPYYKPIQDTPISKSFIQVLKSGKPAHWQAHDDGEDWHQSMMDESFAQDFTALMNCRGTAFGQILAEAISPWIEGESSLLDIGGGSGIYSTTLAAKHPNLQAVVLEQPPVDKIAEKEIARHQLSDRVHVHSGNMFSDPWPGSHNIILLSNVLHDWDTKEVTLIIKKCADYLETGGLLIIHEAFIRDDKTGPLPVAEYSALLMNITQGKCYTPGEYAEILVENNFVVGAYHNTISDRGFITATKL